MEEGDGCNTGSPVGGEHTPTGTPRGAGRAGRVAEGLVLPRMPGNAGGGKEPWFESDTGRMKGVTTGESLTGSEKVRKLQTVLHAKAKEEPGRRPPSHLDCRAVSRCLSRRNAYRPERSAHDAVRRVHTGDDTITGAPRLGAKRAREACAFKGGGDADDRAAAALANPAGTAPFRSWSKCPTASRQGSVPGRHPGGIRQTRLSMIPGAGDAIRHDGRGGARSALRTVRRLCGSLVAHCQRRRREWRMRRSAGFGFPVLPAPDYGLQRCSAAPLP